MRFSDIPGNEKAKATLHGMAATGHIPHALMLSGPPGCGKTLLARAFAQYIHCEHPIDGEPCGTCRNCRLHADLNHPDLRFVYPIVKNKNQGLLVSADEIDHWMQMVRENPAMPEEKWIDLIDAGNKQLSIYVDEADDIVQWDSMPPCSSDRKICIIWLPERMNLEASNKLLKVIEEPSESTLFIMVCNNELLLLPTIFSRVQRVPVARLTESETASYLEHKYSFPPDQAQEYSRLCEGSLIRADELGSNSGESEEFLKFYIEVMRCAYAKKVLVLKQLAEKISNFGREKEKRFLNYMARMIRENFIYNLKNPMLNTLTPEEEAFSGRFSPFINHTNVEDFLTQTDLARRDIERNGNGKIVLFDYFLYIIIFLHRKPK